MSDPSHLPKASFLAKGAFGAFNRLRAGVRAAGRADPVEIAEQLVVDTRTLYTWVHGMAADDYRELIRYVGHRVRRPLAGLRNEAGRRIPRQRTA